MWTFFLSFILVGGVVHLLSGAFFRVKLNREQQQYVQKLAPGLQLEHTASKRKPLFGASLGKNEIVMRQRSTKDRFEQLKKKYKVPSEVGLGQLVFAQLGLVFICWNISGFLHISFTPLLSLIFLIEVIVVYIILRKRRLLDQLEKSFPSLLDAFASMYSVHPDLKHTFATSVEMVTEPVSKRFLSELNALTQVGVPSVQALQMMSQRYMYSPLAFLVSSMKVHEATGGNVAELFRQMATSLRRNQESTKAMNAVMFQNKVSGIVVSTLVPVVLLLSVSLSKNYRVVLMSESLARGLVVGALAWWAIGTVVMYKTLWVRV